MNPETETIVVGQQTWPTIVSAVNKAANAVRPTFGPASNKVIIDNPLYKMVVDDGVQIMRDLKLADPAENAVLNVIRETAVKTNDRAGDGTTGSIIMLQAIINEVDRKSRFSGRQVELELKEGLAFVTDFLEKAASEVTSKEDIKQVALVSFDDDEVAEMIADVYFELGKEGTITIDKSPSMQTTMERTEGMKIDAGFISPFMVNNRERMEALYDNAHILITDYRLMENTDIMPIMEKMNKAGLKNLVILAENVEQGALATMVVNLPHVMNNGKQGTFASVAVALPSVADRDIMLNDIAILTGGKFFSAEKGDKLENAEIEDLGKVDKFICRREETILVRPQGAKEDVEKAVLQLKTALEVETNETYKEKLRYRIGFFTNSLAVIRVGAATENEQRALKYKVEDAVNAVKSALNHGIVCGAGRALLGVETPSPILNEALRYPSRQLAENMDIAEEELPAGEARNVVTGKVGPYMEVGVVDPVEVLIAATESAVSIASVLLTSSGMIVETPKAKE